ncbi:MAG: calcium/sodium antiporter [Bacteroidales bacterium]|nr:calcium/sodium antiporter [Bacteroidales bacterium]MDI9592112.1 calcium/sodium antiporter [Bacteroidota bacterium]OQC36344.1 MAG: Inner membrane protein YrbG [Bacteroidetes bacterium ADurb.Bin041]HOR75429.1 calcium/sodium antiporter [Bacteroidales bacterium]HPA12944.1 calcium/sodium antiporter [Bacteroidales bacterium]
MIISLLILTGGLVLLIKGADWLVNGASALAKKYNVSDLVIGLTVVAFGTSAPEMVINVFASAQNHQDIVFGNVIGSNLFNLFAILGISGIIFPLTVQNNTIKKEIPISFLAIIAIFILANDHLFYNSTNVMSRSDGIILFIFFCFFLFYIYKQIKNKSDIADTQVKQLSVLKITLLIIFGLGGLVVGGKLVINSAVDIAKALGVSKKIIGLTIVAAGTSLPELATSVVATVKKNCDIAVGNIIGSNIFNIFLILSVSSLVRPIKYDISFNNDLYVLAGGTLFLFIAMFTGKRKTLDRWEAMILLIAYIIYILLIIYKGY